MAGPGLATRFPQSLPRRRGRQWRARIIRHQHQVQLRYLETCGAPSKRASWVLSVSCQFLLRCVCRAVSGRLRLAKTAARLQEGAVKLDGDRLTVVVLHGLV